MEASRFLCDRMLAKMARWLRIMGYDTLVALDVCDNEVKRSAISSGRVLLTRDKELSARTDGSILVLSGGLKEQLSQFLETYPRTGARYISRCPICNGVLLAVRPEDAGSKTTIHIPAKVMESQLMFYQCSECPKVYWEGTHWDRIEGFLSEMGVNVQLPEPSAGPEE